MGVRDIWAVLKGVPDPEIPVVSVLDLGIVRSVEEDKVTIGHEATVSKIGDEQLFYLMARGIPAEEAAAMIVSGFIEPVVKELPMEYAVEMNRLIQLQMEGSVG